MFPNNLLIAVKNLAHARPNTRLYMSNHMSIHMSVHKSVHTPQALDGRPVVDSGPSWHGTAEAQDHEVLQSDQTL